MEIKKLKVWAWVLAIVLLVGTSAYVLVNDNTQGELILVTKDRIKGSFIGQLPSYLEELGGNPDFVNPMLVDKSRFVICQDSKLQKEIWSKRFDGDIINKYVDYTFDDGLTTYIFLLSKGNSLNKLTCLKHNNRRIMQYQIEPFLSEVFSVDIDAVKIIACSEKSAVKIPVICMQSRTMDKVFVIDIKGKLVKTCSLPKPTYFAENCRTIFDKQPLHDKGYSSFTVGFDGSTVQLFDLASSVDFKACKELKTKLMADVNKCRIETADDVFEYCAAKDYRDYVHQREGLVLNDGKSLYTINYTSLDKIMDLEKVDSICGNQIITSDTKLYDWELGYKPVELSGKLKVFGIKLYVFAQYYNDMSNVLFLDFANNQVFNRNMFFIETQFIPGNIQSMTYDGDYYFYTDTQAYSLDFGTAKYPTYGGMWY